MPPVALPSREDPLVAAASECIGGPVGRRASGSRWWTPVRVVLAVTCATFLLGMVAKSPCVSSNWSGGNERYAQMCYSDIPYLYTGRGFAEREMPFLDAGSRYQAMEYPVGIGYAAYATALLTHALSGWPDVRDRKAAPLESLGSVPGVAQESGLYYKLTAVLLAGCALGSAYLLAGAHRGRPWDAMGFAAAPALALAGLINWDLLAVLFVAGAMWAWARGRPVASGVLVGLGVATKLYPVFLLGALLVVCARDRRWRTAAMVSSGAVAAWTVANAPALLLGPERWTVFWTFNSERGADLGSLWLVAQQAGATVPPEAINRMSAVVFGAVCVAVLALGLLAPHRPRIASLAFLVVAGFLLVNKVYSPQYVLWLLPFAVLARPRWRDLLIWQAGEAFYFAAVWWYLGAFTASAASGVPDRFYWVAIVVRVAAQLYLVAVVVRDVLVPRLDPARRAAVSDDPMQPVLS